MSIKELLFSLKYQREGDAYYYWKMGLMTRIAQGAKHYPNTPKEASPELFEKKKPVKMPKWLLDDYEKKLNEKFRRKE
jgi:hypothetical protein